MNKTLKTREMLWRWITRPIDYWYWRPQLISYCKKHNILRCDSESYRQLYGITVSYQELLKKLKCDKKVSTPIPQEVLRLLK